MKTFGSDLIAALEAGAIVTAGAVKIETDTPFRVWSGYGDITIAGETYVGIGKHGLVRATGSQLGGSEQPLELLLDGVDPDVIPLVETASVRNAPTTVWRLQFDTSGTVALGAHIFARGRVDALPVEETPGEHASIRARIETAARGMGRSTSRTRSDSDHRRVLATDGGFRWVTQAPGRQLAWGGKPPSRAAGALPNSGGAGAAATMPRDYNLA